MLNDKSFECEMTFNTECIENRELTQLQQNEDLFLANCLYRLVDNSFLSEQF